MDPYQKHEVETTKLNNPKPVIGTKNIKQNKELPNESPTHLHQPFSKGDEVIKESKVTLKGLNDLSSLVNQVNAKQSKSEDGVLHYSDKKENIPAADDMGPEQLENKQEFDQITNKTNEELDIEDILDFLKKRNCSRI